MKTKILLFAFSFLLSAGVYGQSNRIGQHDAVRNWKVPSNSFATVAEGQQIGQQIIDIVGLSPNFEIQAANVPNAAAVVYGGKRYVLYNPSFINQLTRATGTRWAAVSVLAHEIGHHLNGHTIRNSGSQHKLELEADEFSGFVLRKMGASLSEAQVAMKLAAGQRASKTHPGQQDRLVAIQRGWEQADNQMAGRDVARSVPATQQRTVRTQTSTRQAARNAVPISASNILGQVRFKADPNASYFVTTQYNLVKVVNQGLSIIGKLAGSNNARYPYVIYDNKTQLLVDRRGNIVTRSGQLVGTLTARS